MNRLRPRTRQFAVHGCLVLAVLAAAPAHGQENPVATYDEWKLLEPTPELQDYKNALRDGTFDAASRKFLVEVALPQLGMPKNRPGIDFVRRRMRDVLCGDAGGDAKAAASAMQVVADFMTALVRDGNADMATRVNAALLVGELRGPGTKPWAPAVSPLAAILGDDALPPAVRIAAVAGLARHVEADPEARAADVGPAVLAIAKAPLGGVDPVAADWLRSRALVMLARMGSAAPNGAADAAARVLLDAERPIDVRVRAAAAAGRCLKAVGDTDVAAATAAIRELANSALGATKAATDRRELAVRLAGGAAAQPEQQRGLPMEAGLPGESGGPSQVYRRDAWRLATLADALASADGESGLTRFAGPAAAAVSDLAKAMREGAALLDAQPDTTSLDAAMKGIAAAGTADAASAGGAQAAETPAGAAEPAAGVDGVPFGGK